MKFSVEKALQVCGNNNKYQKLFFIAVALTWFSVDFISISFPLLELMPKFECDDKSIECSDQQICNLSRDQYTIIVEYSNLLTEFELYCEKTLVILIGVVYTIGIVIGAILASKFSDVLGRKPVLLICHFLFGCGALAITFAPSIYILLGVLFFIGISCAGGTMVSFLFIYEVLAPNKRSLYGTLINSSFAIAGMIYFLSFQYLKNWKYIAYICIITDVIAGLMILLYFKESPRYLISVGQNEKALKTLYRIARKNGKDKDFYKYLISDLSLQKDYKENLFNSPTSHSTNDTFNNIDPHMVLPKNEINTAKSSISIGSDNYEKDAVIKNYQFASSDTENIQEPFIKNEKLKKEAGFISLIKYKSVRNNFLICSFLWFVYAFTYYGISMDLKKSKEDVFLEGYVVYGAEGVSYMVTGIIMGLAFFGRVRSLNIMFLLSALSCFGYFIIRMNNISIWDIVLLFLARFAITSASSILYTYSTEVYPTIIRAKGLGINSLFARMATVLIPIIVDLINNPFYIFSGLCMIAFCLTFLLPETYGKELEDEILEERKIEKKNYIEN